MENSFLETVKELYDEHKNDSNPPQYFKKIERLLEIEKII